MEFMTMASGAAIVWNEVTMKQVLIVIVIAPTISNAP